MVGTNNDTVTIHYLKSNHFRVIHTDGFMAGPTPHGLVHLVAYNDRIPIPNQVTHRISGNFLGEEIPETVVSKVGVSREVEIDMMMTIETVKSLQVLLTNVLSAFEAQEKRKGTGA
jgi:hypothetical protein